MGSHRGRDPPPARFVPASIRLAEAVAGKVSKRQRDIRRLLIIGAMAVVQAASRSGAPKDSWLARMLAKKPRMLVAIALANKMARGLWAMMTKQENYRNPAAV